MRLVSISDVPEGAVLARDVRASATDAVPLLHAGAQLQPAYRDALARAGVSYVFTEDPISAGIDPVAVIPRHTRAHAIRAISDILGQAAQASRRGQPLWPKALAGLDDVAERLVLEVERRPDLAPTPGECGPPGEYLAMHTVDVTCLGLLVAMQHSRAHGWMDPETETISFDHSRPRLVDLARALLLLDLGAAALPQGLLEHAGPLDAPDRQAVGQHTELGLALLPKSASAMTRAIVGSHHERWDGSGYPHGTCEGAIPWEARLAGLVDVYVAATSNRVYRDAAPPYEGWSAVISGAGSAFDPDIAEAFRAVMVPYPAATEVCLADGRVGVVARADPADPLRPTVHVADAFGGVETLHHVPVQPTSRATHAHPDGGREDHPRLA